MINSRGSPSQNLHRALIASALGNTDAALKHYRSAGADKPDAFALPGDGARTGPPDQLAVAKAMLAKRASNFLDTAVVTADLTATAQAAGPWLTPRAGAAEALFDIATALQRDGLLSRAMFHASLALYIMPAMDLAHLLRGEIWEARERYDAAIAAYRLIAADSPYRLW